jgi:hypothetical protein
MADNHTNSANEAGLTHAQPNTSDAERVDKQISLLTKCDSYKLDAWKKYPTRCPWHNDVICLARGYNW